MEVFLVLLGIQIVYFAIVGVRNDAVFRVRMTFIDADDYPTGYHCLPSYRAMVFNPRYWLLWTTKQWREWIERQ